MKQILICIVFVTMSLCKAADTKTSSRAGRVSAYRLGRISACDLLGAWNKALKETKIVNIGFGRDLESESEDEYDLRPSVRLVINLSRKDIQSLPEHAPDDFEFLDSLNLATNHIEKIPKGFTLKHLMVLYLDNNPINIDEFDAKSFVRQFPRLGKLDLYKVQKAGILASKLKKEVPHLRVNFGDRR